MNYFDLHCDTLTELFDRGESLSDTSCHISQKSLSSFEKYGQVFAVFSKIGLSDSGCYERFPSCVKSFKEKNGADFCLSGKDIKKKINSAESAYVLSVEDARLLDADISRVKKLCDAGVRIVTPLWKGSTCIGGSFDTDDGLTDFGRVAVNEFIKLGALIDVSHASRKSADEIMTIAESYCRPVLATHSNSYTIYPHRRNLTDREAVRVAKSGGIVGISLAPQHLCDGAAGISDILRHIDHYVSLIGDKCVAFGCDFDGIDKTPDGVNGQKDMHAVAEEMARRGYTDGTINKIFYENAYSFFTEKL